MKVNYIFFIFGILIHSVVGYSKNLRDGISFQVDTPTDDVVQEPSDTPTDEIIDDPINISDQIQGTIPESEVVSSRECVCSPPEINIDLYNNQTIPNYEARLENIKGITIANLVLNGLVVCSTLGCLLYRGF